MSRVESAATMSQNTVVTLLEAGRFDVVWSEMWPLEHMPPLNRNVAALSRACSEFVDKLVDAPFTRHAVPPAVAAALAETRMRIVEFEPLDLVGFVRAWMARYHSDKALLTVAYGNRNRFCVFVRGDGLEARCVVMILRDPIGEPEPMGGFGPDGVCRCQHPPGYHHEQYKREHAARRKSRVKRLKTERTKRLAWLAERGQPEWPLE